MKQDSNWYVIYTKPRSEKKVFRLLTDQGVIAYCPLNKVEKKWSDRMKIVEIPLFTSYVFVHITEKEMGLVKQTPGVVNFLHWCGVPAIIKEEEIIRVKKFLADHTSVEVIPVDIKVGEEVVVEQGIFMGEQGSVQEVEKKYVTIILNKLGYAIRAKLPTAYIKSKSENS